MHNLHLPQSPNHILHHPLLHRLRRPQLHRQERQLLVRPIRQHIVRPYISCLTNLETFIIVFTFVIVYYSDGYRVSLDSGYSRGVVGGTHVLGLP